MVTRRRLLLLAAAVIAGAGLAYELSLMLLGAVTVGSSEQANAVVLGAAMFGMGIGATAGGRLAGNPVRNFVAVEASLAVIGAAAAPSLYWSWARLEAFWGPLLFVAVIIGMCIGAEMPLLAAINDRLSKQDTATVVAEFTAADYFGALLGATAFAFLIRPQLGIVDGTILVAALNVVVALGVGLLIPAEPGERRARIAIPVLAVGALAVVAWGANPLVDAGRQALFRDPIVASVDSGLQQIVVTERVYPSGTVDARLYLDGDLQLSSLDEYRYHEALVWPTVAPGDDVLILGGGDCLAVREALRVGAAAVTLVELDPGVTKVMQETPALVHLGADACGDERVTLVHADAFRWVRELPADRTFDAVIADFPDPDTTVLGRLYSVEMYGLIERVLAPNGQLVVQCGSPFFAPEAFWTCEATLAEAGWTTTPYHVDVPSFGDWGFHLAARGQAPTARIPDGVTPRFLTQPVLDAALSFAPDLVANRAAAQPSTVLDPVIVDAARGAWLGY